MLPSINDRLAKALKEELAMRVMTRKLPLMIAESVVEKLSERAAKIHQDEFLRANKGHIEKYRKKLIQRFNEMEREVLRNMRKNPGKAYKAPPVKKDFDVSSWLMNREAWYGTLTGDGQALTAAPLNTGGLLASDELLLPGFDQTDPWAIAWIEQNAQNAAFSITTTQYEALKETLMTGIADGESIWTLRKRIEAALEIARNRAEMIARTEVLKASNRGSWLSYRQSGLVEGKAWLATYDQRTCEACSEMDGATMPLDEPFFKKGKPHTFSNPGEAFEGIPTEGGVDMKFDYEEIQHPPLHPNCRCTLVAILK
jgi:SPP1 gp7 family putative phage head morphogenesis protein